MTSARSRQVPLSAPVGVHDVDVGLLLRTRSSGRRATRQGHCRCAPSCAQHPRLAAVRIHDVDLEGRRSAAPARPTGRISVLPTRRSNAILCPSGDQAGAKLRAPLRVSLRCPLPSAFMTQTLPVAHEGDPPPVGRPDGVAVSHRVARQPPLPAPVGVHDVDLQVAVAPSSTKAIFCPSGDQAGAKSRRRVARQLRCPLPSAFMT